MKIPSFKNGIRRLPLKYLPFADAASVGLPMGRLLRLSLFQVTVGMSVALMLGTLNRVMIVELGVAAWLVALMVAIPLLVAPFRAVTGFKSDTHRSAFGWRRVPYIWTGTMVQFMGLTFMPFALLVLTGQAQIATPAWFNQAIAGLSFLFVGIGLQTSQTAGLALAKYASPLVQRQLAAFYQQWQSTQIFGDGGHGHSCLQHAGYRFGALRRRDSQAHCQRHQLADRVTRKRLAGRVCCSVAQAV